MNMVKRVKEPGPDDTCVSKIEMDFHLPVYISPETQQEIYALFRKIVKDHKNQLQNGVHWASGHGSKPRFSKADAAFLGKRVDEDAPDTGEPTFDNEILYLESTSRGFVSADEMKRHAEEMEAGLA